MNEAAYWNATADLYQIETRISTADFHFGPLLPGDKELGLLPESPAGMRCLEVGCGAGQNSIVLARRGARCTALDCSTRQLALGEELTRSCGVRIDFQNLDMDDLPIDSLGRFDLVHSTYALPFSREPEKVIADVASLLNPGGIFLLTTGHPVYAGEWIELSDDDEQGVFLPSYFHPPPDHRPAEDNHNGSESCSVPPSTVWSWLTNAGLTVDRFLEPEPLPIPDMTEEDIQARVPYESDDWRALYPILSNVPTVAIFRAIR